MDALGWAKRKEKISTVRKVRFPHALNGLRAGLTICHLTSHPWSVLLLNYIMASVCVVHTPLPNKLRLFTFTFSLSLSWFFFRAGEDNVSYPNNVWLYSYNACMIHPKWFSIRPGQISFAREILNIFYSISLNSEGKKVENSPPQGFYSAHF